MPGVAAVPPGVLVAVPNDTIPVDACHQIFVPTVTPAEIGANGGRHVDPDVSRLSFQAVSVVVPSES